MRQNLLLVAADEPTAVIARTLAYHLLSPELRVFVTGAAPGARARQIALVSTVLGELGVRARESAEPPPGAMRTAEMSEMDHIVSLPAAGHDSTDQLAVLRRSRDAIMQRLVALSRELAPEPAIGIIGGSGFYDLPGLAQATSVDVDTPYGAPSAAPVVGRIGKHRVVFLTRHGQGHRLLPSEVNARANLYALKRLGVTRVISVSAVGSLRDAIAPGDVVLPSQFLDRTQGRPGTFFGAGAVAHVSLADPVCAELRSTLAQGASAAGARVHDGGTYVCIEGPQFSTRAESEMHRALGADVVGMTNLPEARLAREAELCYATLALPTDYDCWRTRDEEVYVPDVIAVLQANVERARRILVGALEQLDAQRPCACRRVLDTSLLTAPAALEPPVRLRLHAILGRRLATATGTEQAS